MARTRDPRTAGRNLIRNSQSSRRSGVTGRRSDSRTTSGLWPSDSATCVAILAEKAGDVGEAVRAHEREVHLDDLVVRVVLGEAPQGVLEQPGLSEPGPQMATVPGCRSRESTTFSASTGGMYQCGSSGPPGSWEGILGVRRRRRGEARARLPAPPDRRSHPERRVKGLIAVEIEGVVGDHLARAVELHDPAARPDREPPSPLLDRDAPGAVAVDPLEFRRRPSAPGRRARRLEAGPPPALRPSRERPRWARACARTGAPRTTRAARSRPGNARASPRGATPAGGGSSAC